MVFWHYFCIIYLIVSLVTDISTCNWSLGMKNSKTFRNDIYEWSHKIAIFIQWKKKTENVVKGLSIFPLIAFKSMRSCSFIYRKLTCHFPKVPFHCCDEYKKEIGVTMVKSFIFVLLAISRKAPLRIYNT